MRETILKFGGTSLADADAVARVPAIVRAHGGPRPVMVVSALAGATDLLLAAADAAARGAPDERAGDLDALFERHREIAGRLVSGERLRAFLDELDRVQPELAALLDRLSREPPLRPALRDEIASYGERLSSSLLSSTLTEAGLAARWVDARHCLITDGTHGRATPLPGPTAERTQAQVLPLLDQGLVPVLGGYIAATPEGVTTTLGRGGSDYTAALVGAVLGAREIQIWTDVSGVLTADPRVVPEARPIPTLSYREAAELAYFGAKVLHPKTIQPAMDRAIPVRICNSRAPDDPGTVVTAPRGEAGEGTEEGEGEGAGAGPLRYGAVKAIAHKTGITVLQITSARMLGAYGFLRALFEVFDRHRTAVDVVATSEVSVSLTVDDTEPIADLTHDLGRLGSVGIERDRAIVCVVGEGLRTTPGIAARVFETIRDINVSLISQGASRVNLTFVVEAAHVEAAVRRLHSALFERGRSAARAVAARSRS
ncbi:MAG TPA: lysine-sensitive aspartokinase 3 [Gemmatimonadales bacterium]|nr:lysine-sensitive aspartokinase 3 [Gemmatimonadales bacterium]